MLALDSIKDPVASHLEAFDSRFRESLKSNVPLLNTITRFIYKRKGKQIRPLFVFLSARTWGEVSERTYVAASLIEMLHTATLVHDDVVDDSHLRRGLFSVNALWKNKIAVLVGDFLLSRGMLLALEQQEFGLLRIVSQAVREMSEGELLQMEKARRLDISEEVYFEIIRKKTASLIASCCACGAASAGTTEQQVELMRRFGEIAGIAFQIKDDLMDYTSGSITGKPNGLDIKDRKMTLPLIHLLNQASLIDKQRIIYTIRYQNNNPRQVTRLLEMIRESGGLDYAQRMMVVYRDRASGLLTDCPPSRFRDSLQALLLFVTDRKL